MLKAEIDKISSKHIKRESIPFDFNDKKVISSNFFNESNKKIDAHLSHWRKRSRFLNKGFNINTEEDYSTHSTPKKDITKA